MKVGWSLVVVVSRFAEQANFPLLEYKNLE